MQVQDKLSKFWGNLDFLLKSFITSTTGLTASRPTQRFSFTSGSIFFTQKQINFFEQFLTFSRFRFARLLYFFDVRRRQWRWRWRSVWPDWAFLQVLGKILSHKSNPNIMVTFWTISYNVTIMLKVCGYFLGNFWGKLATFYSIIWSHWWRWRRRQMKNHLFEAKDILK